MSLKKGTRHLLLLVVAMVAYTNVALVGTAFAPPNPADCTEATKGATVNFLENGGYTKYTCECFYNPPDQKLLGCWWLTAEEMSASTGSAQLYSGTDSIGATSMLRQSGSYSSPFVSEGQGMHFTNGYLSNAPAGWLAVANTAWRWSGSTWTKCADSGFSYSAGSWAWLRVGWTWSSPPCGTGYYSTNAYSFVWDGGTWQGNPYGVYSGYKYWNGCIQCLAAPTELPPNEPPPVVPNVPKKGVGKARPSAPGAALVSGGPRLS